MRYRFHRGSIVSAAVVGVDVGTSSTKGVLVALDGTLLANATRAHDVSRPAAGHVEMDGSVWWDEFVSITRELLSVRPQVEVVAVGVSGMGPCTLVTGDDGQPLRPAILYGVDMRATEQIRRLDERYGQTAIVARGGSALTSQAVGPKLEWLSDHEPDVMRRATRLFMPSSYLAWHLTGEYLLDHHSASQSTPLYDTTTHSWYRPWWDDIAGAIAPPRLAWADAAAGTVTTDASAATGIPVGVPVTVGTVDAWAEAVSVGAHRVGDLMLMYGTTMFLVCTVDEPVPAPPLWSTVGVFEGTRNLAGGMAASGAITSWLRDLTGSDYSTLTAEAAASPPGAAGLVMLPYFAGERTPFEDPAARGVVAGLTLDHTRGDLYRAALEATAFGVRHHLEAFTAAGAPIRRIVAVGGGSQGDLWTQIVSDVTGVRQERRRHSIGASFGSAFLAARLVSGDGAIDIDRWNPPVNGVEPDPRTAAIYDRHYELYRRLYDSTAPIVHALADTGHLTDRKHEP
ncbi:FGGY family carbohydrate kinase [Desertimonas flava]|uniref:FGGY-family carbohydrate kinase n=1 Tax=Desertimonas flava TaxID=2064846 RepID=UPI000E34FCC1